MVNGYDQTQAEFEAAAGLRHPKLAPSGETPVTRLLALVLCRSRARGLTRLEEKRALRSRELRRRHRSSAAVELDIVLCSGQSWRVQSNICATSAELRAQASAVSGIPEDEVVLVCGNEHITDEEAPLVERAKDLQGNAFQVTLVRMQKRYVLASHHGGLRLWDANRGVCVRALSCEEAGSAVALDWAGQCALSGGSQADPAVKLWDLAHGICVETMAGHEDEVICMSVDWERQRAITGCRDHSLRLWDLGTAQNVGVLSCKSACARWREVLTPLCVGMHWPSRRAITGMDAGGLKLWDLEGSECITNIYYNYGIRFDGDDLHRAITCLAVDWSSKRVLCGSADTNLKLWDISREVPKFQSVCTKRFAGHTGTITSVAVDWQAMRALSAAQDGSIRLWDLARGKCLRTLRIYEADCNVCVAVDWGSGTAISGSWDGLKLWDLDSDADTCVSAVDFEGGLVKALDMASAAQTVAAAS